MRSSSSSRKTKGSGLTQRATKQIVRRTHACPYCPRRCTRPSELAEHVANHRGDKRHACVCDYSTAYRSNLNRHRSSCKVLKAKNEHSLPPDTSSNGGSSPAASRDSPEAFGAPSSPHAPSPSLSMGGHDIASFDGFLALPFAGDGHFTGKYDPSDRRSSPTHRTLSEQPTTQPNPIDVLDDLTLSPFAVFEEPLTMHTSEPGDSLDAYFRQLRVNGFDQADAARVGQLQHHPVLIPPRPPASHGHYAAISPHNEILPQYSQFLWAPQSPYSQGPADLVTRRDAIVDFGSLAPSVGWSMPDSAMDIELYPSGTDNHLAGVSVTHRASPLIGNLSLSDFEPLFG